METLLTRLKADTRPQHQQTEALLYTDKLMAGTLTRTEYEHLLAIHYVFHQALEGAVADQADFFAGYTCEARRKTPWLVADLNQLGVPLPRPDASLFANWSGYQLLGALYVAEGSTLGAQFIARTLRRTPGLNEATASRFLGGYGEQTGALWKTFGTYLTSRATGYDDLIVNGAGLAFAHFQHIALQTRPLPWVLEPS